MSNNNKVRMFFLPSVLGISHTAPMVKAARFFASHPDVQVTIITTLENSRLFENVIVTDRESGHDIGYHIVKIPFSEVGLPDHDIVPRILASTSTNRDDASKFFKAWAMLSGPILDLARVREADCLVSDLLNPWAANVASEAHIPLIMFSPAGLFQACVDDTLARFKPHENVGSDMEPFVLPGLPDKVELTRSRLPDYHRGKDIGREFRLSVQRALDTSHCIMVNSFSDIEFKYVEYCKNVMGWKCCLVGPLHCYSGPELDKGGENIQDKKENALLLQWLDHRAENSVLYASFGSYAPVSKDQFHEIAYGLEASGHSFIWVVKANLSGDLGEHNWFPEGFEERVKDSNQGLILKTWAPQELILGHPSVGAFVTHCGWNSCLESLSNGVPVITWPLRVEQFNECFMVDVLRVGFRVGNEEWTSQHGELKVTVTRNKVEAAAKRMMNKEAEEVIAVRKRAQDFVYKSKVAVQKGGSSHHDVCSLVEELKLRRIESIAIA